MYKFMSVCGSGLASSFLIEETIQAALKQLNTEGEVSHTSVGSFAPDWDLDFVIVGNDITDSVEFPRKITLDNLFDVEECKQKISQALTNYKK
ncbi:PTS system, IIBC component, putative [Spiroplasma clarkii]|uniref:PTS system, ascorbate-specific IIB component n=1 Tax=Spiroplasma clarkii TaxID=2139 RepID=A0A1Y0L1B8_9MOLU|nr:PTS sugar transporter subunit IIB [Spiroplasma clarkii]ARU91787.1 PTS system, IIBC component, putative [Spiroplasma clarkii]ATX71154.1 PTS system, ascorbate-specific IIB component [Spiroplasma clarkii]